MKHDKLGRQVISVADFLTEDEINQAVKRYTENPASFAKWVEITLITPNIARINKALGQECNERFLAYAVEYAALNASKGGTTKRVATST